MYTHTNTPIVTLKTEGSEIHVTKLVAVLLRLVIIK